MALREKISQAAKSNAAFMAQRLPKKPFRELIKMAHTRHIEFMTNRLKNKSPNSR